MPQLPDDLYYEPLCRRVSLFCNNFVVCTHQLESPSMFCPSSNDTFLNITEKTKLLAQKCTNQIQVIAGGQQQTITSKQQQHPYGHGMGKGDSSAKPSLNCLGSLCLGPVSSASAKGTIQRTAKWYVKVIQYTEWP